MVGTLPLPKLQSNKTQIPFFGHKQRINGKYNWNCNFPNPLNSFQTSYPVFL